jgi:hypothetical protein
MYPLTSEDDQQFILQHKRFDVILPLNENELQPSPDVWENEIVAQAQATRDVDTFGHIYDPKDEPDPFNIQKDEQKFEQEQLENLLGSDVQTQQEHEIEQDVDMVSGEQVPSALNTIKLNKTIEDQQNKIDELTTKLKISQAEKRKLEKTIDTLEMKTKYLNGDSKYINIYLYI